MIYSGTFCITRSFNMYQPFWMTPISTLSRADGVGKTSEIYTVHDLARSSSQRVRSFFVSAFSVVCGFHPQSRSFLGFLGGTIAEKNSRLAAPPAAGSVPDSGNAGAGGLGDSVE